MSPKSLIWIGMAVGSTVGSFIPLLWGGSELSISSVILSTIGGAAGIFAGFKMSSYF